MNNKYAIDKISNPSDYYKKFIRDYITFLPNIAGRGEEDIKIWGKLEGKELETAKQYILKGLSENPKVSHIRAIDKFRDPRAISILKDVIQTSQEKFIIEKLYAAKVLFDWIGYKEYIEILENVCKNANPACLSYIKYSESMFLEGLPEKTKEKIRHYL